jgi:hypothetical protein
MRNYCENISYIVCIIFKKMHEILYKKNLKIFQKMFQKNEIFIGLKIVIFENHFKKITT